MSIRFKLTGYDDIITEMPTEPFCVNDYDGTVIKTKELIDDMLLTNLSNEDLSLVPSCQCGEFKGYQYSGEYCESCNTIVKSILDEEIDFKVWVRQPIRVQRLIQPWFLYILLNRYKVTKPSVNLVEYIIRTNYRITGPKIANMDQIERLDYMLANRGISRGYNSFVENFNEIIEILELNYCRTGRKQDKLNFVEWARSVFPQMLSGYIPVLNKSLFILDASDGVRYMNRDMTVIVNAVRRMTGIDIRGLTDNNIQNRTAKFLVDFANFYADYFKSKLFKKYSLIRQNTIRTRSHFTLRAVVSSRTDRHQPNELLFPWSASTSVFKMHIMSGLIARGYSYKDAQDHLSEHVNVYSPIIDEIFNDIVNGKDKVPVMSVRNPSQGRGSILSTVLTGIKKDPDDNTVTISYQNSPSTNMDFDGDMLQFTLIMTNKAKRHLDKFETHNNILSSKKPNQFGGNMSYPKSIIGTIANWLDVEEVGDWEEN